MSAYSDWKCGGITDEQYTAECNREAAMDRDEDSPCNSCEYYKLSFKIGLKRIMMCSLDEGCIYDEEGDTE